MWYSLVRGSIRFLARCFFRIRIIGHDRIPRTGPVLFAPNHVSFLDIPMLSIMVDRHLHFIGRANLFKAGLFGWLYRTLNGIPLGKGASMRVGLMEGVNRLKAGNCVVLYPEGRRSPSGKLQRPQPGIGWVASLSGAKVVPVYISGTEKVLPVGARRIRFHPVSVYIGEPIDFTDEIRRLSGKALYLQISGAVIGKITQLEKDARTLPSG